MYKVASGDKRNTNKRGGEIMETMKPVKMNQKAIQRIKERQEIEQYIEMCNKYEICKLCGGDLECEEIGSLDTGYTFGRLRCPNCDVREPLTWHFST